MSDRIKTFFNDEENDNNRIHASDDPITRWLISLVIMSILFALIGYWFYNKVHLFDRYRVIESVEASDVEGTKYVMLGSDIIKYSHDGVFCSDIANEVKWSIAYSIQSPICDTSGETMVIAEQQGHQVYILGRKGQIGAFTAPYPIRKAYVAKNGVTALILDDADITWVNLYNTVGEEIASIKTRLNDTGYPIDAALTDDAKRMTVSYLGEENGNMVSTIAFYDFSSSADKESHMKNAYSYMDSVYPDVYYIDQTTPVAVGDNGYIVYSSAAAPKEKKNIPIDREIISCFHDDKSIGFVFHSNDTAIRYDMEAYDYSGKRTMSTTCDFEYTDIKMADNEIFLYDSKNLNIYRVTGRAKLAVTYEKEVRYFEPIPGFRKYLVITNESVDRIKIR